LWEYDLPAYFVDLPDFVRFARKRERKLRKLYEKVKKERSPLVSYLRERLLREDMSDLFLYMSIVESALRCDAVSPKKAKGIWQFVPSTARRYDLSCDERDDERNDPVKSTEAAIAYLQDLYARFGKWYLAVMAYNCGEGRLERAVRKAGGVDDPEVLLDERYGYIPDETRSYLYSIVLLAMIAESEDIEVSKPASNVVEKSQKTLRSESEEDMILSAIVMKKTESAEAVAKRYGVDFARFKLLNPTLKDTIPEGKLVIVPFSSKKSFKRK
jgi:membrane-bound lytic murein transglycosylase D